MGTRHRARPRVVRAISFDPLRFYPGQPFTPSGWFFRLIVFAVATAVLASGVWGLIALAVLLTVAIAWAHHYGTTKVPHRSR